MGFRSPMLPFIALLAGSAPIMAGTPPRAAAQMQADNSKANQDKTAPTADQQKMNTSDREITRNIRKAVMADKSLSVYAHNVKIITQDGKVTLRGPVRSDSEKATIEAKAAEVAGQGNVTSMLDVAPAK